MADEVDLSELADLMTGGSALPPLEETTDVALKTEGAAAAGPHAGEEATDGKHRHRHRSRQDDEERHDKKKKKKHHKKERDHSVADGEGEDDDEDEEEERKRSRYVIDAAESTDGDGDADLTGGDDEDDGTEEGLDEGPRFEDRRNKFIFHEGDEAKSADELGREYEQRVRMMRRQRATDGAMAGAEGTSRTDMATMRYASRLMPKETDPKVFAVRVQPRQQRALVARIVNKCYRKRTGQYQERTRIDLGIISVFAMDRVKEYIYVEAYRKEFVSKALNGLVGVMLYDISVVEPTELLQMLEKRPATAKLPIGALVRMRQRFYKGDLAEVAAVHQDGTHVTVKVVPREDFLDKSYTKATSSLAPRFFAASRAIGAEDRGDHYRWGDLRFDKDGYLLKVVTARMLIAGALMEKPSTEELARFYNHNRERVRAAIQRNSASASGGGAEGGAPALRIGDSVRVASGQLRDTVGTIANIFANNHTATLSCQVPSRREPVNIRVELSNCARHFSEGTHVIVEKGDHAGEGGTVVKSYGDTVVLFADRPDGAVCEVTVHANDCHQSKLVGSLSHSHGTWQLFDLVTVVETNAVACVTGLSRGEMMVLTESNETRMLSYAEVKPIVRSQRQTSDPLLNVITRGCEVTVRDTALTPIPLVGQNGRVEQVFSRTLFVHCRALHGNAGLVALDASCVLLIGGRTTTRATAMPKMLPAPHRRPHNATRAEISAHTLSTDWQASSEY